MLAPKAPSCGRAQRRYEMTVVTAEDAAQIERLKYVLANSVKENLVNHLREWPGVHSVRALLDGKTLGRPLGSTAPGNSSTVCAAARTSAPCGTPRSKL